MAGARDGPGPAAWRALHERIRIICQPARRQRQRLARRVRAAEGAPADAHSSVPGPLHRSPVSLEHCTSAAVIKISFRGHLDRPGHLRFFRRIHALCVGLGAACVSDLPFLRTCLCYQHATIETSHENVPQIAPHPAERRESTSSASRASSTLPATAATHTPPAPRITPTRILVSRSAALPPLDRSRDANTEAPLGNGRCRRARAKRRQR